jgi:putative transposase
MPSPPPTFFSIEVLTSVGIVRYHVLFAIDLKSRRVEIAGIVRDLHQGWVLNATRALLDPIDGFLKDARYLIHDRDPLFGAEFSKITIAMLRDLRSIEFPDRTANGTTPFG